MSSPVNIHESHVTTAIRELMMRLTNRGLQEFNIPYYLNLSPFWYSKLEKEIMGTNGGQILFNQDKSVMTLTLSMVNICVSRVENIEIENELLEILYGMLSSERYLFQSFPRKTDLLT